MIKGDYDYLKDLASRFVCPEHGMLLVVAWHATEDCYVLRCGAGHYPEEVVPQASLTELWRQGKLPDGPIADNIERRERQKAMQHSKQSTAVTFTGVPAVDLATGELLSLELVKALVDYATKYHLDAARSHVVLMYSKPYITIDGYLYHANQVNLPYKLKSRPLNDQERKDYRVEEDDHAWLCEIIKGYSETLFTGLGIVTKKEMEATAKGKPEQLRSPVVAAHPHLLAQKRAEWQALRRAFPIGEHEEVKEE